MPTTSLAGVWLFDCLSVDGLISILEELQKAGCVMLGFDERYALGETLGVGSFSKVFYAEDRCTGNACAAKIVSKSVSTGKDSNLMKEVCMLRRAAHENVLQFHGVFMGLDPCAATPVWIIVTEFIGGGELFERVRQGGPLSEDRAANVIWQLLASLRSLHERGIVHRDIKTENVILIDAASDSVKLVDFGLATPETDAEAMAVRCGTPGYIAPEVLRNEKYGCKIDCFSIGVLLYILVVGRGPFRGKTMEEMLARNMVCKVSLRHLAKLSPMGRDLILRLLSKHSTLRPTAAQALDHPWFASIANAQKEIDASSAHQAAPPRAPDFDEARAQGISPLGLPIPQRQVLADGFESGNPSEKKKSKTSQAPYISSIVVEQGMDERMHLERELATVTSPRPSSNRPTCSPEMVNQMHDENGNEGDETPLTTDCMESMEDEEPLEPVSLLRSQTPMYAEMQAVVSAMRSEGFSPRNTTCRNTGREAIFSDRGTNRGSEIAERRMTDRMTARLSNRAGTGADGRLSCLDGRMTGRVSEYFTRECGVTEMMTEGAAFATDESRLSGMSLKDLADSDVRIQSLAGHEDSAARISQKILSEIGEGVSACVMEHIFDEMPDSYSHGSRKHQGGTPRQKAKGSKDSKDSAGGSGQAAARKLRHGRSMHLKREGSEASSKDMLDNIPSPIPLEEPKSPVGAVQAPPSPAGSAGSSKSHKHSVDQPRLTPTPPPELDIGVAKADGFQRPSAESGSRRPSRDPHIYSTC
jgi:serine/threonine protein kinase